MTKTLTVAEMALREALRRRSVLLTSGTWSEGWPMA